MTDIRKLIRDRLLEHASITRVHVGWIPQNATLPCITLNVVSSNPFVSLTGPLSTTVARLQIDVWGKSIGDAITLRNATYSQLHCLVSPPIIKCVQIDESDRSEAPQDGSDNWLFRIQQDYEVQFLD